MNAARRLTVATLCLLAGGVLFGNAAPSFAAEPCPNEQLRAEQPYGLELPDCRAYEMVSPTNKNDNNAVLKEEGLARASVSGEAITYASLGSFADPVGSRFVDQYVSRRTLGGWSTQSITPPYSATHTETASPFETLIFTPDLSKAIALTDVPLTGEAEAGFENIYVDDLADGSYQLVTNAPPSREPYNYPIPTHEIAATTDLSRVVFLNQNSGSGSGTNLDEWEDGRLSLVAVAPNGEPMQAVLGGGEEYGAYGKRSWRAMSDDGSRVFMTSPAEFYQHDRQVYVRENAASPVEDCLVSGDACTVEVSASKRTVPDPNGPLPAQYLGASVDGSKVFFTGCQKLTDDSTASSPAGSTNEENPCGPGKAGVGNDLYEYDLESGELTDLTVDTNVGDPNGAAVLGVADISEDGSYVYFVAEGDLAGGAVSGQPNLYLSHDGETPTFIATLAPGSTRTSDSNDWQEGPGGVNSTVRATPDGTRVAFLSLRSLTGYDNRPAEPADCLNGENEPSLCQEVFSYNAGTGSLICVSCNPNGARPVGNASFGEFKGNADRYIARNFSGDGSRLFFQSDDALVPHDSNGMQDVYEYEDGRVYLLSDGAGDFASSFLDASASGNDVFIATADQLVPQDQDERVDLYDVRVGGGFPVSVAALACDNGDSCKPSVSAQPGVFGVPASATFSGVGNIAPVESRPAAKSKSKPLTRAQQLANALRSCRRKPRRQQARCESRARKRNGGPKSKETKSDRRGN